MLLTYPPRGLSSLPASDYVWPELIVFDCDGVLVDSEVIACEVIAAALRSQGVVIDAAAVGKQFTGRTLASLMAHFTHQGVRLSEHFSDQVNMRLREAFAASLQPIAGMADMLSRLRTTVCVASSSQIERVRFALTATRLIDYFNGCLYTAESVAKGKPAPDLFLFAARQMRTLPKDCLVIEDSVSGVRGACAAGMLAWGFTGGSHLKGTKIAEASLRNAGAERVFTDISALSSALPSTSWV